jgi:NADP-dependent aldehyde dehydrogenase
VNPVFILSEALNTKAEEIATGLHGSVTLGVGQFCTNPGLVFIEAGPSAKSFLTKLEALIQATPAGTMLTAGLCAAYQRGVKIFSAVTGVKSSGTILPDASAGAAQANAALFVTNAETFLSNHRLMDEVFGPSTLVVECASREQLLQAAQRLEGQLTATIHGTVNDLSASKPLVEVLTTKVGRVVFNGFPTGVEVAHAMTHGGPYPASSDGRSTSVGTRALERFLRPVSFQNCPEAVLPDELKEANPLRLPRLVDGKLN